VQLVVLAAGHGRRFGGLKQLAAVGPNGESIMDYTARDALACGYSGIVLVVREEIASEIAAHVRAYWPGELAVELVCQPPRPGTAEAVLAAREHLEGTFAVANADDHYGEAALRTLAEHLAGDGATTGDHVLVAYRLDNTILTDAPVKRGLCELAPNGELARIVEREVRRLADGRFESSPLAGRDGGATAFCTGEERVSMNLWAFSVRMLACLERAVSNAPTSSGDELLLPDVVGDALSARTETVRILATDAHCIGLTHPEDLELVRSELARELEQRAAGAPARG
jgi:CTP:molybdopterin cytidylyltransferase MocA